MSRRIEWIDHARGMCIVLVVMLYATDWIDDVTGREGWLHALVDFAAPFRMPALLFVSGLLLSKTIADPWPRYLERKVAHFAYFYVLWLSIAFLLTGQGMAEEHGWTAVWQLYLQSLVRPYSWLWFIYLLPFFFVATKLLRRLPLALAWGLALGLHLGGLESGIKVVDKFTYYYLFFVSGYALAPYAFQLADKAAAHCAVALAAIAAWAALNALALPSASPSLLLAFAGIAALVAVAALMAKTRAFDALRYCGAHSLVIYVAFFAPTAAARGVLTRQSFITDDGTLALLATLAGVLGALLCHWLVRGTPLAFLFERPRLAPIRKLDPVRRR